MEVRGIRQTKVGTWEATIQSTLLPKGRAMRNFETREEAESYKRRMLSALEIGVCPPELNRSGARSNQFAATANKAKAALTRPTHAGSPAMSDLLSQYLAADNAKIARTDRHVVLALGRQMKGIALAGITTTWSDAWVRRMKREEALAPGTIRKKVEALARAIDWWNRKEHEGVETFNPLRVMPKGYSAYRPDDVSPGQEMPIDTHRDRRLHPGEAEAIEAAIQGSRRPDRERSWGIDSERDRKSFLALFRLITYTGLRLREAYRLRVSDVKFELRTIHIRRSKTGALRDVPMTRQLEGWLKEIIDPAAGKEDIIFPFWSGSDSEEVLRQTSNRLSRRFSTLFEYARCRDLTEHDLRHEATCRWMDMKDSSGRWLFRPEEVRRITGHRSVQIFERYLSLRGSDLAERLG